MEDKQDINRTPVFSRERVELQKQKYYVSLKSKLESIKPSDNFFGPTPPNLLVGAYGYPNIRVGAMLSLGDPKFSANPSLMYGKSYGTIISEFGLNMLGTENTNIKRHATKTIEDITESVLSYKPIDMEINFKHAPALIPKFSDHHIPTGYTAPVKDTRVAENPKIPKVTYKAIADDIKAAEAVKMISEKTDTYYTTRLLSAGLLGKTENKKLVPSRWAITAVDDIIAKEKLKYVREFPLTNYFEVYTNDFLHNRFVILLCPGPWEYEQFEAWPQGSAWSTKWGFNQEYEPYRGRKEYAEKQAGGYYAARIGVVEHLHLRKRQAKAIVFREIDSEYSIPVGVWQVRENVINALHKEPARFERLNDALEHIRPLLKVGLDNYLRQDMALKQRNIFEF